MIQSSRDRASVEQDAGSLLTIELATILSVAEAGSFSSAARVLGVRQSTVSRRVLALEDHVGVSLFERTGAGVRPTDAGRQLLGRVAQIRNLVRTALDEARDAGAARTGRLRLGFVGSFSTPPAKDILGRLRALHPGLRIQLAELGATELVQKVIAHELDCAWVGSWRSPDPVLTLEALWHETLYLATPSSREGLEIARWANLTGQILLARPQAELDLLFPALDKAGVARPEVQFHDCSRESLLALVAEGEGVAILPESFARLGTAGVHFARIDEARAGVAICATYRRDTDNPALRRLLVITREWIRENQARPAPSSGPG
jgi:DNA-binding transcriptional LysR family regulator